MLSKDCNIQASSLAESVIAMALVAVCLVVVTSVLSSVVSNTAPVSLYEGRQEVKKWAQETQHTKQYTDDTKKGINYSITRSVSRDRDHGYTVIFTLETGKKKEERTYKMYE